MIPECRIDDSRNSPSATGKSNPECGSFGNGNRSASCDNEKMRLPHAQRGEKPPTFLRILVILILIGGTSTGPGETLDDDRHRPSSGSLNEPGILRLSEKHQKLGGIVTRVFHPPDYLPETRAFGKVLSLEALLELRQRWQQAASERKVAAAALAAARTAHRQIQDLFNDEAVARLKLEQSKMQWIDATARYDQAGAKLQAIRLSAEQSWGKVLTAWLVRENAPEFDDLIRRKCVLLAVSLAPGESLPEHTRSVLVHRSAERSSARPAELISTAPRTDERSQGESYFFQTTAESLRTGMRLYVWVPIPGAARKRVEIPASTLVWADGAPWIYLKTAPDSFQRRRAENAPGQSDRWFVPGNPDRIAEIVVSGGQTLLSQEYRWQIPDENHE
jgi:hypothetical protein